MTPDPAHTIRIVTAASLFDGHDAAINIMRRILQSKGAEIIHLGHNRSAKDIVECAIEEDAHGIAITSYQGGHLEFFRYVKDLLNEAGCGHIRIFGGGGGTILPEEIQQLQQYGITRIYSPDDGRTMGLTGMIDDVIARCRELNGKDSKYRHAENNWNGTLPFSELKDIRRLARSITLAEQGQSQPASSSSHTNIPVLGITGTGGAGKSTVTDELVRRFLSWSDSITLAVISVDPSRKKSGGALLGDRIRMNAVAGPRVYMRSLATRSDHTALSGHIGEAVTLCRQQKFDLIIVETAGVGQSDTSILDYSDFSLYVMTPEYGAASQLEKINMLDYADIIVVNKSDKAGAADALIDVRKQYKRNRELWTEKDESIPVLPAVAARFNDTGMNSVFDQLLKLLSDRPGFFSAPPAMPFPASPLPEPVFPADRYRYLAEIAAYIRKHNGWIAAQSLLASNWYRLQGAGELTDFSGPLQSALQSILSELDPECRSLIENWKQLKQQYSAEFFEYEVRGKKIKKSLQSRSLSGTPIPRLCLPSFSDWGDILKWQLKENLPGKFPYTAGVFELKRQDEDPTRMFAGEGAPERTNKRFHYLSAGLPAVRLSTAFDSVTLYGENPDIRPDIFGKIGNAGVNVATVDDAKKLYSGFDLSAPNTSVSMTINGPAPMMLAFYFNAAIDQQCERYITREGKWDEVNSKIDELFRHQPRPEYSGEIPYDVEQAGGLLLLGVSGDEVLPQEIYEQIKSDTLRKLRGTIQADILKEDQAQNTCIFSTEFALRLMGDVQEYFIDQQIRNFYSVSISGYHIAEAGANPVTQLAFTLANGFTYLEYYLARGMKIDDFAPNLSFFFSNGMDPEYSVIGRVARRIWSRALRYIYKGNTRSQKLKYHIQTSGRSLHAQEIDFNDIRTTLQALYAIYDNCNSLHTNAYDEAITTPTAESVRRAMAIQLIINHELGTARNENILQGSFLIEELTDLVEEAVLSEFDRLTERGGVLGAMERMYQRNKIQEESMLYEQLKNSGELPVIGVNTFLNKDGSPTLLPQEVFRSTDEEKNRQIESLKRFHDRNAGRSAAALTALQHAALQHQNVFAVLMDTVKYCSLGQITHALYEVGGQYRRGM